MSPVFNENSYPNDPRNYSTQVGWPSASNLPLAPPGPAQYDWRDQELMTLRSRVQHLEQQLFAKENTLRDAYMEIGRLHETLRGLTAFDKWSAAVQETKPLGGASGLGGKP